MKKIYLISAVLLLAAMWSCKKEEIMLFSDVNRINFADSLTQTHTFYYDDQTVTEYKFMLRVNTIGDVVNYPREVKLVQVPEYDVTYVRDNENNIIDTVYTEIANMARPGVHYRFDADEWIVPAGANTAMIPVTLLRDASLGTNIIRLRVGIVPSEDFQSGEVKAREKTITFSDQLLRPAFWNQNTITILGNWSVRKHAFMIETSGKRIDQEWYDTEYNITGGSQYWDNFFNRKLAEFNADPANIASGEAPLKDENGQNISF